MRVAEDGWTTGVEIERMVSDKVKSLPQVLIPESVLFGKTNVSKKYGVCIAYDAAGRPSRKGRQEALRKTICGRSGIMIGDIEVPGILQCGV